MLRCYCYRIESVSHILTKMACIRVPALLLTKNIPGLFQDYPGHPKRFPGLCRSPAMLNYTQRAVTYSVYAV